MSNMTKTLAIFSGSTCPELAEEIASSLGTTLGNVKLEKFSNGEIYARYLESDRGADVFIVQSTSTPNVNEAIMELLIMADAAKRASARTVNAVVPCYGYARQDRKAAAREPITAKLVANLMTVSGINRVITVDLHQGQIQGFFDTPVDHLTALPIFADYFKKKGLTSENLCVVSPDVGRAKAAKKLSDMLESDLAIMHKGRPGHNKAEITALIGDVAGKTCIVNDDMIATAGTLCAAVATLKEKGADKVYVCASHPVFSGPAYERIAESQIDEVVVCNTIRIPEERRTGKIRVISVAPLLARAIRNVYTNESVASLFDPEFAL